MRVIVTRPQADAGKWVDDLCAAGHEAKALPLMEVSGPASPQVVEEAWDKLETFNAVMFVSGNAATYFLKLKPPKSLVFSAQAATKIRAFAPGPGTAAALLRAGVPPTFIDAPPVDAAQFDSEALWAVVKSQVVSGFRLLVVRGAHAEVKAHSKGTGRDWFADQVRAVGGTVEFVVAYRRGAPIWTSAQQTLAQEALVDGSVWLFTSSEAVMHLPVLCAGRSFQNAKAVATHARIAQAVRSIGFGTVVESAPSLPALLSSIESLQ